jgi:hypothetical protein
MEKGQEPGKCARSVESLLAEADVAQSAGHRWVLLARAREMADGCLQAAPDDPDAWFIAGLASYDSLAAGEALGAQVEEYLTHALKLDSKHQFARLYLGHYKYDTGHYEDALSQFIRTDQGFFSSLGQQWRLLKLHELVLCCKINLGSSDVDLASFRSLFDEYLSAPDEDVPVPMELATTLQRTARAPIWRHVSREEVLRRFIAVVREIGYYDELRAYLEDAP